MPDDFTEIIIDPGFATLGISASQWAILTHHGVVMIPQVKNSILRLDVSKTSGANWHGELRYAPFPVEKGQVFEVSFAVRAKRPFTFSVWLGQMNAPYGSLVTPENHFGEKMMTSDWQTITHTWEAAVSEPAARLNFVLGQIDNEIEIKAVSLKRRAARC